MAFEITLEDIKKVYFGGSFPEGAEEELEYLLEVVEAEVRQLLKNNDRDLDEDIENGVLNEVIVRNIVASVVKRTYDAATSPAGDTILDRASQVTQSAGVYSTNISFRSNEYSVYFKRDEKRKLGITDGGFKVLSSFDDEW